MKLITVIAKCLRKTSGRLEDGSLAVCENSWRKSRKKSHKNLSHQFSLGAHKIFPTFLLEPFLNISSSSTKHSLVYSVFTPSSILHFPLFLSGNLYLNLTVSKTIFPRNKSFAGTQEIQIPRKTAKTEKIQSNFTILFFEKKKKCPLPHLHPTPVRTYSESILLPSILVPGRISLNPEVESHCLNPTPPPPFVLGERIYLQRYYTAKRRAAKYFERYANCCSVNDNFEWIPGYRKTSVWASFFLH